MPSGQPTPDLLAMAEKQGETYEAVRTIKHAVNNMSQKIDAITTMVAQVEQLARDRDDHEKRLAVLEADKHRREGAIGLVAWLSTHWPFTVIVAAAVFFTAWWEGKFK